MTEFFAKSRVNFTFFHFFLSFYLSPASPVIEPNGTGRAARPVPKKKCPPRRTTNLDGRTHITKLKADAVW